MSDEIDIEEHDVLENPVIRNIFPDITIIKEEISQYEDLELSTEKLFGTIEQFSNKTVTASENNIVDVKPPTDISQSDTSFHGTKIILGSKPSKNVYADPESEDASLPGTHCLQPKEEQYLPLSLVGIGISAGRKISDYEDFFEKQLFAYDVKVQLDDLKPYLERCGRYCKKCLILFSSKCSFDIHTRTTHTINYKIRKPGPYNRCKPKIATTKQDIVKKKQRITNTQGDKKIKSHQCNSIVAHASGLRKHYDNLHHKNIKLRRINKIISSVRNNMKNPEQFRVNKNNICFHCKKKFSSQQSLIEHLYNILQSNIFLCKLCPAKFYSKSELKQHVIEHKQCVIKNNNIEESSNIISGNIQNVKLVNKGSEHNTQSRRKDKRKKVKTDKQSNFYKCYICSYLYIERKVALAHLKAKHGITEISTELKKVKFDPSCKFCSRLYTTRAAMNSHLLIYHKKDVHTISGSDLQKTNQLDTKTINPPEDVSSFKKAATFVLKRNKSNFYKCYICNYLFKFQKFALAHLKAKHGITATELEKVEFDPWCKFCSRRYTTRATMNSHLLLHQKKYVHAISGSDLQKTNQLDTKNINPPEDVSSFKKADTFVLKGKRKKLKDMQSNFYKCYICSYLFIEIKFALAHLKTKHGITEISTVLEKVKFDPWCKFCSRPYTTRATMNSHLLLYHKKYVNSISGSDLQKTNKLDTKNINPPKDVSSFKQADTFVLKNSLFKCLKCDIHFISAKTATNHTDHMEMLINWKCSQCKRIFKQEDSMLHVKQHEFTNKFTVYDLFPVPLYRVLYNCSRCAVHFVEDNFLKHCSICETEAPLSVYCKICDILIDSSIATSHEFSHEYEKLTSSDFTIVDSDILPSNKCDQEEDGVSRIKESTDTPPKIDSSIAISHGFSHEYEKLRSSDFTIVDSDILPSNKCHQEEEGVSRIKESTDTPPKIDSSIATSQEFSHEYEKLTFSDFTIVDLDILPSNKCDQEKERVSRIKESTDTPPKMIKRTNIKRKGDNKISLQKKRKITFDVDRMFNLSYCNTCKCFSTDKREVHLKGCCTDLVKYVCKMCGLVLTAKSYETHKNLHAELKNIKLKDFNFYDISSGDQICPPLPEYFKCEICEINFISKVALFTHECGNMDYLTCHLCEIKLTEEAFKLHFRFHNYASKIFRTNDVKTNDSEMLEYAPEANSVQSQEQPVENVNIEGIIYRCQSCHIAVDEYDKAVEHCQGHFSDGEYQTETETCPVCDIIFDKTCYEKHRKLHSSNNKNFITVLNFDTFYFTSDNWIWIKHVFGTIPYKISNKIVSESIYKTECRIKMDVIQNGPPDLTVYKCDKCRNFVDETNLYKHAENACFKLRKHACTSCGLPFISSVAQMQHEKIHIKPNIKLKSYRIVTFNKEEHNKLNKLLYCRSQYYVLYQCRNCFGVVDKHQTKDHKCYICNLKKCSKCGLFLDKDDYEIHILRHNQLTRFIQKNIKIILFGDNFGTSNGTSLEIDTTLFGGTVYDYTLYCCSNCETCVRNVENLSNHSCALNISRVKCPYCHYYFVNKMLKRHTNQHEMDQEYVRENIRIISFQSSKIAKQSEIEKSEDSPCTDSPVPLKVSLIDNKTKNTENVVELNNGTINYTEQFTDNQSSIVHNDVKLYKCKCGLHFLDPRSTLSHIESCNRSLIRTSKLSCSKCNLLFNSNTLFSHLLMHHGEKNQECKFEIIDMVKDNIIYKCFKCDCYITKDRDIITHLKNCIDTNTEGTVCEGCKLKFKYECFASHNCKSDVKIIDLNYSLKSRIRSNNGTKNEDT